MYQVTLVVHVRIAARLEEMTLTQFICGCSFQLQLSYVGKLPGADDNILGHLVSVAGSGSCRSSLLSDLRR